MKYDYKEYQSTIMTCEYKEHPEQKLVEIVVDGKITEAEFDALAPRLEAFIAAHGKVKIIEIIKNFAGFDMAVLGKGFSFDMKHMKDFSHCAVVTDSGWIGPFTRLLAPFFSIEIRTFGMAQEQQARQWLSQS